MPRPFKWDAVTIIWSMELLENEFTDAFELSYKQIISIILKISSFDRIFMLSSFSRYGFKGSQFLLPCVCQPERRSWSEVCIKCKVEKIFKKIAWIWSHHLHLQWKFNLLAGKFTWGNKAKHCWVMSTNFLFPKVCWQCPAMFCLYTSSKLSHP